MDEQATSDSLNGKQVGSGGQQSDKKHSKPRLLLEWVGPSRVHVQREHNFFIALFIIAVIAAFILVLLREYTLMLVVFALAFTVYAANKHEPKSVTYQITTTGIFIDNQRFNYDDLKSFWFEEEGSQMVLKIATSLMNPHYIDLVINPESREAIEDELLEYIPYEYVEESRPIRFIRRLIFPGIGKEVMLPSDNQEQNEQAASAQPPQRSESEVSNESSEATTENPTTEDEEQQ